MDWYIPIAWTAIVSQLLFVIYVYRNYHYALSKYQKHRNFTPDTTLIIPCKGIDSGFDENICSFFLQDFDNYRLWFVVADKADPAYERLQLLKQKFAQQSRAKQIQILVAGSGRSCSQKVHNLLYGYEKAPPQTTVLAFGDSDVCAPAHWLRHLVHPLHKQKYGAASGYRWFVPPRNNLASLAMSAINAKVAQLLGNSRFNQAWGGSMAIRKDIFEQAGLKQIWSKTLSDDLSLSLAVRKTKKIIAFVPACLVASYHSTSWSELFEFGRRQFLITRINAPATWAFGLFSCLYSIAGLWAGLAAAIVASAGQVSNPGLFAAVPIAFVAGPVTRAIMRQTMIRKILKKDIGKLFEAQLADILGFWFWDIVCLIIIIFSGFGRTIRWRGIRYRLQSPTDTRVVSESKSAKNS